MRAPNIQASTLKGTPTVRRLPLHQDEPMTTSVTEKGTLDGAIIARLMESETTYHYFRTPEARELRVQRIYYLIELLRFRRPHALLRFHPC